MNPSESPVVESTPGAGVESGASQSVKAQLRLREMILAGELPGGARIAELAIVEKLGVSRTPIRAALMRLEQEGLLQRLPGGGYAVRTFSETDVADAIALRGTLEGLAARLAVERGVPPAVLADAHACLDAIDATLVPPALDDQGFARYVELNAQFHVLLGRMLGGGVVARELERVKSLPFASPSAFVLVQTHSHQARDMLVVAQDQHRQLLDAIEHHEGARAEAILREHSRLAQRNLRAALSGQTVGQVRADMPALTLIRRNGPGTAARLRVSPLS
ncbi:GntR family transcriptional regulator [Acidovorax sp. HMWF029]|uniref:GntR family transcriptional regulator n=1 Tax=Acidovorax sp. HMWF029 TaxID=2056863 RepID=UPI000D352739|nr:GntR family transcriptional regulator [Acidovorax sp. HMWF029]PTT20826.1 GntR family transcriptional regulator [Acidovorax sp. HMWF029]